MLLSLSEIANTKFLSRINSWMLGIFSIDYTCPKISLWISFTTPISLCSLRFRTEMGTVSSWWGTFFSLMAFWRSRTVCMNWERRLEEIKSRLPFLISWKLMSWRKRLIVSFRVHIGIETISRGSPTILKQIKTKSDYPKFLDEKRSLNCRQIVIMKTKGLITALKNVKCATMMITIGK